MRHRLCLRAEADQLVRPASERGLRDMSRSVSFARDVGVIGGGGHVGLPLALTFADCELRTVIYDIDAAKVEQIRAGRMPFAEDGAPEMLARVLASRKLEVESTPEKIADCRFVVLIVGTPVDEHLNPGFTAIHKSIDNCAKHLR